MPTLHFKGKTFVQNHHLAVKYHQLVPKAALSLTDTVSLHDNLIVQGDNLKALKALLPTYAGKVKCIYIDPPYNTGNENWVYNDNVNSPMIKEWLGSVVDKEDMTRHDKWLCMMMPRLKLLRELLSEDGAIFISCDDNEQHNLRVLLDEIFGQQNFIQNIIWQKKYSPQNDAKYFSDMHDFVICYAKNKIEGEQKIGWERNLLVRTDEMNDRYSNADNDPRGDWKPSDFSVKTYSQAYDYPITLPSGRIVNPPQGRSWRTSKENYQKLLEDNRVSFGKNNDAVPQIKRFLSEVKQGVVPLSIWFYQDVGHNQDARKELKELFSDVDFPFETPKPVSLIKQLIKIATKENDIILDSFAGSGTTAHAVLALNKEDGGKRKFILIEQEDYANTITAERVRRVIKRLNYDLSDEEISMIKNKKQRETAQKNQSNQANQKNQGSDTFSYFELGETIEMESLLRGEKLPSFTEFARYLFYTATGEEFNEKNIDTKTGFIGESKNYEVYLFYKDDIEWLKQNALTLDICKGLPKFKGKQRLVFAPAKYVDDYTCLEYRIDFCQLPYEIYRLNR
ncbi:MAG: site-specific DNA-methyltransferase [Bacteroidia bacterium]|nr:site-specific DNA-methyltransferase [Bacteroidia bacterium]